MTKPISLPELADAIAEAENELLDLAERTAVTAARRPRMCFDTADNVALDRDTVRCLNDVLTLLAAIRVKLTHFPVLTNPPTEE